MSTESTEASPGQIASVRASGRASVGASPGIRAELEATEDEDEKAADLGHFFNVVDSDASIAIRSPVGPRKTQKAIRPTVMAAARTLARGEVVAARDPSRGSLPVAVVRTENGRLFVVPDECPHDGGLLSDGFIDDGRLVCARHGWEFDPETGQCPQRSVCIESRRLLRKRRVPTLPLPLVPSPLVMNEVAAIDPEKD